jgi:hypothetical protein
MIANKSLRNSVSASILGVCVDIYRL